MATTTTNFGWDIPQSTDLVKDGATAIAALGQDIDTALVDLKGGTTGQVLAKASASDLDFSWVAQDDSNAIQNAIVDAKGDIIAATANDTPARLAVGANDTVLTADSSTATGLKWAAPAAGGGWTSIASGSLPTGSGTLSLTSISGSYKNLRLVVRNVGLGTAANLFFRFNNVSTGVYERVAIFNNVDTGTVVGNGNQTEFRVPGNTNFKSDSNASAICLDLIDYTNTTSNKLIQMTANYVNSSTGEDNNILAAGSMFQDVPAAITRIDMIMSTGSYSRGTYILYGGN